nr:transposase [Liquorilactobacillus sucicola]
MGSTISVVGNRFYLSLMTDFLYIILRHKKRTFPVRSLKPTTTKILEKEGNVLMRNDTTKLLLGIEDIHIQIADGARENVKIIVTDMNYTYPKLAKTVFPNAIVVVDKFHIINALNRAFNKTRVRLMKHLLLLLVNFARLNATGNYC